jgi:hypothetical protein
MQEDGGGGTASGHQKEQPTSPSSEMLQAAEEFLVEEAQRNLDKKKLESLMAVKKDFTGLLVNKRDLVVGISLIIKLNVGRVLQYGFFLQAHLRFTCTHGMPAKFQTDEED